MMSNRKRLQLSILGGYVLLMTLLTGCGSSDDIEPPAALPWTVDETQIPSLVYPPESTPAIFEVNLVRYTYSSTITYEPDNSTFVEKGDFDITEYHNGFIPGEYTGYVVGPDISTNYYRFIGEFSITGARTTTGVITIEQGSISMYIDLTPDNSSRDKDVLIGSAEHLFSGGAGATENPDAIGSFEAVYDDFKLTPEGRSYWRAPQPFYVNLDFYGDVLTSERDEDNPNIYNTTGAGGAYFPSSLPEPTTSNQG